MPQLLRTKIVCTIGPASREPEMLTALIEAGMDVARLNFSHGEQAFHAETIARIRAASAAAGKPIAILGDLQGPKLRVGVMQEGGVPIAEGETLALTTEHITGAPGRVPVQYELLPEVVEPGDRILIDDGLLELVVTAVAGPEITTRVVTGGILNSNKGLNLPRPRSPSRRSPRRIGRTWRSRSSRAWIGSRSPSCARPRRCWISKATSAPSPRSATRRR